MRKLTKPITVCDHTDPQERFFRAGEHEGYMPGQEIEAEGNEHLKELAVEYARWCGYDVTDSHEVIFD